MVPPLVERFNLTILTLVLIFNLRSMSSVSLVLRVVLSVLLVSKQVMVQHPLQILQ